MQMGRRQTQDQGQADLFGAISNATMNTRGVRPRTPAKPPAKPISPSSGVTGQSSGLLNTHQAAVRLGLSKSTLDKMRCAGTGPKFIKPTGWAVRYDPIDLDNWIIARRKQKTTE